MLAYTYVTETSQVIYFALPMFWSMRQPRKLIPIEFKKEGALWCFLNPCSVLNIATPLTFAPTDIQCLLFLASIFFESVASLQFMLIKVKLLLFILEKNYLYDCLLKTFRSELVVFVFCVNSFKLLLKSLQHYSITGTPPIHRGGICQFFVHFFLYKHV